MAMRATLSTWGWLGARTPGLWEAPLTGAICVGKPCLLGPHAFFESNGLANLDFDDSPYKTSGRRMPPLLHEFVGDSATGAARRHFYFRSP